MHENIHFYPGLDGRFVLCLYLILPPVKVNPLKFRFMESLRHTAIELKNNKLHGLLPPGGSLSPPAGFASFFFDQGVP